MRSKLKTKSTEIHKILCFFFKRNLLNIVNYLAQIGASKRASPRSKDSGRLRSGPAAVPTSNSQHWAHVVETSTILQKPPRRATNGILQSESCTTISDLKKFS